MKKQPEAREKLVLPATGCDDDGYLLVAIITIGIVFVAVAAVVAFN